MSLRFQGSLLYWATNKMEAEEMKTKSAILGTLVITLALILLIIGKQGFCDDAGDPYSSEGTGNIGAWYDETWQASGFYRLQRVGTSDDFRYEYTTTPTTASNPTFVRDGSAENRTTTVVGEHSHSYTDATSGASLPQDIVVTEWRATGHVHFTHQ